MVRRTVVLAGLMSASFALAGCGGSAKVAETTTTTLPPLTLPITLSAVESFFDGQGGGAWKKGPLMTGPFASDGLFNFVGMAQDNDTCPASISGISRATAVSVISVHCATAGPPNTTFQQAVALYVSAVQKFAPAGVAWTELSLRTNTSGTHKRTFGNVVLEVDIASVQETADLSITAKGFAS